MVSCSRKQTGKSPKVTALASETLKRDGQGESWKAEGRGERGGREGRERDR